MTNASIECFLAICRHKTVSKAAESLFITQSSLSIRLKTLEKELGGALFLRKKGSREMALTPAGQKLYELALQYSELTAKMLQVCAPHPTTLRVSAINSLGTYFLPEVYEYFLQSTDEYTLEIQDMERESAESSICKGLTDLAFTSGKTTQAGLLQTPLFREPMVLICSPALTLPSPVSVEALGQHKEAYVEWSRSFAHWHQETFEEAAPRITVSIMAQLEQFVSKGDYWAIVPVSVARGLEKSCKVIRLDTDFPLPTREISLLSSAQQHSKAAAFFLECLRTTIATHKELHPLL